MADPTSSELDAQLAELTKKRDELKAAEEEASRQSRAPEVIVLDFMRATAAHLGNSPRLEKLIQELEKVTAPKE